MRPLLRLPTALLLSSLVHALLGGFFFGALTPSLPGLELQSPENVEFGFVDVPVDAPVPVSAEQAQPESPAPSDQALGPAAAPTRPRPPRRPKRPSGDAGLAQQDGGPATARGAVDAGVPSPATRSDAGAPDGGPASAEPTEPAPAVVAARTGAQVSLRVNVGALRGSPMAADLGPVLVQLPDVKALLGGSGIEPLRDLDRLWVASPDLSRERAAVAGQYRGGQALARTAAETLARAANKTAKFSPREGVEIAPWYAPDGVPRRLALLGEEAFVVARESDLSAVLAVARHLSGGRRSAADLSRGLLSLPDEVLAQLDVEGAQHFVRDPGALPPRRLTATLRPQAQGGLRIAVHARFADPPAAQAAADRLQSLLTTYGKHPLVLLMGLGNAAASVRLGTLDDALDVTAELSPNEVSTLMVALKDSLVPPPAAGPPPTPTPPLQRPGGPEH